MPGDLNTLFKKGFEALNKGDFQVAKEHLTAVLKLAPASPEANSCLGFVEANLGNLGLALDYSDTALKGAPKSAQVRTHRAFVLVANGREDEAITELQTANKLAPGQAPILNQLARLYEKGENFAAAEPLVAELTRQAPKDQGLANRYIRILLEQDKGAEALKTAKALIGRFPEGEFLWGQIANAARAAGKWALAREYFEKLVSGDKNDISNLRRLARCLIELDLFEEVILILKQIYDLDPSRPGVFYSLGYAFFSLQNYEESTPFIEKALELEPDNVNALLIKGRTLVFHAELEEARVCFERALELDPRHPMPHMQLNKMSPLETKNETFDLLEDLSSEIKEGDPHQSLLGFALAEMYEAIKDYDQAFHYYSKGNKCTGAAYAKIGSVFDEHAMLGQFQALKALFTKDNLKQLEGRGNPSQKPIFIVAMPRSGTTLLEQIISSHSKVYGAGELATGNTIANRLKLDMGTGTFEKLNETLAAKGKAYANEYLDALPEPGEGEVRFSDKMPGNFLHLGLLQTILPQATYIHLRRNPLDTCISMFRGIFNKNFPYASDLYTLGLYYRQYDLLMKHWATALPRPVLEITYEDLVTNSETLCPEILKFCGLDWEPECLEYYKKKHKVITMSTYQVRKPINTSGLGKWRRFEKYIGPLLDGLGEDITSTLKL